MHGEKRITIAMVTFNCSSSLQEAIESIVHQTYNNKELVIIDGNSTDTTLSIIKEYSMKYPFVEYISEVDNGIYDAMNKALNIATGDFLIFMGSDDHFVSYDTLERVARHMVDEKVVYYGDVWRPLNNDIYCGRFYKYKLAVKNISHQALFYPKSIYKTKQYSLKYRIMGDYVYNLELWNDCEFEYIKEPVSFISQFGLSSNEKDFIFEKDRRAIVCKSLGMGAYIYASIYHFLRNLIKK